jgi:hypothetical protein
MTLPANLPLQGSNATPMKNLPKRQYKIAVLQWYQGDDLAKVVSDELSKFGHSPVIFTPLTPVPEGMDLVFTYAPFGKFMPIVNQLASLPVNTRPLLVHWNTEGMPDLRIPWQITRAVAAWRSGIERLIHPFRNDRIQPLAKISSLTKLDFSMMRFRFIGDYYAAYSQGILSVFSDSSAIYADIHNKRGLPTVFAPWGSMPRWYADLGLERDIDVLWMGIRGSKRRSQLLDRVRYELKMHGVEMYIADNEENPFIFGNERTEYLNRAKITLNITRTWYDDNFSRFSLAAPNRSLVVSEKMLPHCPSYQPGVHYVEAKPDDLAQSILFYLQNPAERERIVEAAYCLTTEELTFNNSIKHIMDAVDQIMASKPERSEYSISIADYKEAQP